MWDALSYERTGLSFTIAAGPRQRSHSRVRVSLDSRPYFTASDSRLPFSLSRTTRRVTVEVFDSASTRDLSNSRINSLFTTPENRIEITASKGSITVLHECVVSEKPCVNSQATVWFSKCLQFSASVSLETVFRNQLVSRNQPLRGNVFANSFPRNGPHVTVFKKKALRHRRFVAGFLSTRPCSDLSVLRVFHLFVVF
jgi:hypothetical protein